MKFGLLKVLAVGMFFTISSLANAGLIKMEIEGAVEEANNGWWEISTIVGSYNSLESELTAQVWWGDKDLAVLFKNTYRDDVSADSIAFAYKLQEFPLNAGGTGFFVVQKRPNHNGDIISAVENFGHHFVIANKIEVPEPSTFAVFALGMIGLASRRFKNPS